MLKTVDLIYDVSVTLKDALIAQIHKYLTAMKENIDIATLLDPRMKNNKNVFQKAENRYQAEMHLKNVLEDLLLTRKNPWAPPKKSKGLLYDFMRQEMQLAQKHF